MKDLFKIIGIKTFGDLEVFKKNELDKGETLIEGLKRYIASLGENFKLEEQNGI